MKKINTIMIDNDPQYIAVMKEYFHDHPSIEIMEEANNGLEGIELILEKEEELDLILLDLIMPHCDGIRFLEYLKEHNIHKKVIVLTGYQSTDMIQEVLQYGVNYLLLKPFTIEDLERRILKLFEVKESQVINLEEKTLQVRITDLLHHLGMPSNVKGYHYLREAIQLIIEDPSLLGYMTKELYPTIADKFQSTTSRVERAMRHAIEISFTRGNLKEIEQIFRFSFDREKGKPSNSEFISTIAEKVEEDMEEKIF